MFQFLTEIGRQRDERQREGQREIRRLQCAGYPPLQVKKIAFKKMKPNFSSRPLNKREKEKNYQEILKCSAVRKEVTVCQSAKGQGVDKTKTYTFDGVFGLDSTQREVYAQAVAPIVDEVLKGFNCTIFAYGQTGTGKTYTMEGKLI